MKWTFLRSVLARILTPCVLVALVLPLSPSVQEVLAAPAVWAIQTVDSIGDVGFYTSLAFDPSGSPGISYQDQSGHDLKYAEWNGVSWDPQLIDMENYTGYGTSLAFDSEGRAGISHYAVTSYTEFDSDLRYAHSNGSSWDIQTVDSEGCVGWYTSLAFDALDRPAIGYCECSPGRPKYAKWNGSTWDIELVSTDNASYVSLAFDSSGRPAMSYQANDSHLAYASYNGSAWNVDVVDGSMDVGEHASLAFDPSGRAAISYYDAGNEDLKYAHWNGSSWDIQTVDSNGSVGRCTSLAFDPSGNPAIAYEGDARPKFASWNGSSWDVEVVDSQGGGTPAYTSLAFDHGGRPGVSYYDNTGQDLNFARAGEPPGTPTNISPADGTVDISWTPNLQSSPFSDPDSGDTHAASQWQIRTASGTYSEPAFDSGSDSTHLLEIAVPSGYLSDDTTYYWHVRHQDHWGAWSDWSPETSFATLDNLPPYQPVNLFPVDGTTGISRYTTLHSSEFSDPESHTHHASQWQIRTASGSYASPVFDTVTTYIHLTSVNTPPGTLGYSSAYYWHVRYQDNHGAWSSWSNETSFNTVEAPQAPQDYWAVIIGIASYQDPASNLWYTDDDADSIHDELAPAWGEDHMLLLTDGDAAKSDISDAILNWLDPLEDSDDVVLIFFAGHGAQADGHEYLVPWDGIGIRDDEFAGWVGQLESENIVVILGSCLSGGFIAELAGGGRVVLTASRADESAWQTLELGHSSFGFYLLEALDRLAESDSNHNNQISAEELFGYAQPRTVAYMASFGISQHPQMYDPYAGELVLFNTAVVTLDMSPYVASLTVDGVEYEASELPRSFVFIEGTTHTVSAPTIVEEASQETRYSFASWSDNYVLASRIIVIDGPTTYTANYKIEHHLDVGSEWGDPQGAGWYEEGQTATFSVSPLVEKNEGSRLTFTGWSGDSAELTYSSSLVMDGPMSVEANWKSEHMLTVESEYGNPQGGGWYADGTIATFSVSPILDQGEGSRYAFTGWSGDLASTSPSSSVAMDEPKVVRANWALQYRLSISVSPPGLVTIRGDGWYDAGATAWTGTAEGIVTSPAEDTIFRFAGWIVDGSEVQGNRVSVVMSSPHTLLADYDVQYLLLVKSKSGDPVGTGWYESGSTATISVTSPEGTVIRKVFAGWSGDSHEMTPTATVIMDGPKTVTANWRTDYIQAYVIVGAAAGLIAGGLAIVILVRRARRRPAG